MKGSFRLACAALSLLAAAGCSSTPVREGIWELSFVDVYILQSGEDVTERFQPKEVSVVASKTETSVGDTSLLEITPLEEDENLKTMYAEILPPQFEDRPVIKVDAQFDRDWSWHMIGNIRDEFTIVGTRIDARGRFGKAKDLSLEGRWNMRWLRDLDA